ncbi:hypothetical protein ACJJTC_018995 [Scirpophaga incertulas]
MSGGALTRGNTATLKSKRHCTEAEIKCSHCGGQHTQAECESKKTGEIPKCINCNKVAAFPTCGISLDTSRRALRSELGASPRNQETKELLAIKNFQKTTRSVIRPREINEQDTIGKGAAGRFTGHLELADWTYRKLGAPSTGNPKTGSLGPIVPEISGFNQIGDEFGDGLSRELLELGAPSLGSLGRARGGLSSGEG